jgi:hypothetical protein
MVPVVHKYDMAKAMEEMEDDDKFGSDNSNSMQRKEQQRQMCAADKKARKGQAQEPPAISYASTPELHGNCSGFLVDTVANYEHLYDTAIDGDLDAVGYFAYLNTVHQRASLSWSPGIVRLIQGWRNVHSLQDVAVRAYKWKLKSYREKASQPGTSTHNQGGSSVPAEFIQGSSSQPQMDPTNTLPALSEGFVNREDGDLDNYMSTSPPRHIIYHFPRQPSRIP